MSEENVEVVQEAIAALNDWDAERYLAICTPDVELVTPLAAIEGSNSGAEGIRDFFAGVAESSSIFHLDVEDLQVVDEDRIVAFVKLRFESEGGVPLIQSTTNIYEIAGGKLRRVTVYDDRDKALEAAGLRE